MTAAGHALCRNSAQGSHRWLQRFGVHTVAKRALRVCKQILICQCTVATKAVCNYFSNKFRMASELFMLSSPAERAQELVRFIRNNARDSDITPLAEAAASGDFAKLFEIIFHQHNTAFRSCSTEDLEGAFTIVFSLISALPEAARQSVVQQIASAATASTDSKTSATRIRMCVLLVYLLF